MVLQTQDASTDNKGGEEWLPNSSKTSYRQKRPRENQIKLSNPIPGHYTIRANGPPDTRHLNCKLGGERKNHNFLIFCKQPGEFILFGALQNLRDITKIWVAFWNRYFGHKLVSFKIDKTTPLGHFPPLPIFSEHWISKSLSSSSRMLR